MSSRQFTLSSFQQEKLKYYFKFFQPNEQNVLDEGSLAKFMKRVLEYTGWDPKSSDAREIEEVHEAFFEILFDKTAGGRPSHLITLEDWLAVWTRLIPGCKGMMNFPVWLRLLPKTLFRMMDRDKDAEIAESELCDFYLHMVNLPEDEAKANSHLAYAQMTDNGRYPLNMDGYEQIFSNFLLGQTPHGPGRHIFGCFEHSVDKTPFRLIKPASVDEDMEREVKVYLEKRPKRMSLNAM
ncbi:sarcoplasmic calcium-binding proteins II, V, VI, and VII-like [Littorina saxatilis]|uniref:Sarcoplasmic calcium-binding proteins I, III, and IV n=1 Tax=Littorina saxatilis TaxID=31220 RepID=A0AAN9BB85_9CAEN